MSDDAEWFVGIAEDGYFLSAGDARPDVCARIRSKDEAHLLSAARELLAACTEALQDARERDEDLGQNAWPAVQAAIAKAQSSAWPDLT